MKRLPEQNDPLEFKQEAVRQIEVEGKRQADVARELGVIEQTLHGWRKAHRQGKLTSHFISNSKTTDSHRFFNNLFITHHTRIYHT